MEYVPGRHADDERSLAGMSRSWLDARFPAFAVLLAATRAVVEFGRGTRGTREETDA